MYMPTPLNESKVEYVCSKFTADGLGSRVDNMDLNSTEVSPIVTDPAHINKSKLRLPSKLLTCSQSGASFSTGKYMTIPSLRPGKLEDFRLSGWLDAMKSSSPRPEKLIMDLDIEVASEDFDPAYGTWMLKYPSALSSFEQITNSATNKKIVMFLDYDGTLSPIVDDPDHALMSGTMRSAVRKVSKYFPTAIISGRSRDKVYKLVGLTELYYAGSHGMDIMDPVGNAVSSDHPHCTSLTDQQGKEVNLFQPAREFIPVIDEVFKILVDETKGIKGVKVENHKFCVSVHYRNVEEKNWHTVAECVHDVLKGYSRLRITHGRKVLEVRPMIDWNKGKAVEFLLESLGFSDNNDVLPIYIGDDKTDEDAFKVLRDANRGFGILVSSVPKVTSAYYSLRDPLEVMRFLKSLVRWKKIEEG